MSNRARNFRSANSDSPVVYGSVDGECVTYRLANGKMFYLNAEDARQVGNPLWAFTVLAIHERENADLLAKVEQEAGWR